MEIIEETTASNAKIIILSDGDISPEDKAMLQALYSRDPQSIKEHLKKVGKGNSFMERYYVGYGHDSIADCAPVILFIENISMLAAKAIQDNRLYSGQEVSTRYVDYSTQLFLRGSPFSEKLRSFYLKAFPEVETFIMEKQGLTKETMNRTQINSVKAATFDILRGFLPAGAMTSCSWTTNIRQLNDHLAYLKNHPLVEVKEIAVAIEKALGKYAPNSIKKDRGYQDWYQSWADYKNPNLVAINQIKISYTNYGEANKNQLDQILTLRPERAPLPPILDGFGFIEFMTLLDFGSYRDLQRHRAIVQFMPILNTSYGFHKWYLNSLPENLLWEASTLLKEVEEEVKKFDKWEAQYIIPMGYQVPIVASGGLASLIYMVELRSGPTVHPTLQNVAKWIGEKLDQSGIKTQWNKEPITHFSIKRGTQTIESK